ncbi:hypothetical protein ACHAW6_010865 [Cyclotella cf. meneghiniana]
MKTCALCLILAFLTTSTAQLNRVVDRRQVLRVRRRDLTFDSSNDSLDPFSQNGSKASKAPTVKLTTNPTIGKANKPPNVNAGKTKSPTLMPSMSPSKAGKTSHFSDEESFSFVASISLSMISADSLSFSMISMASDPDFDEWQDNVDGFEWIGESLSMSMSMSLA